MEKLKRLKSKFLFATKLAQLYSTFMRNFSAVYQLTCLWQLFIGRFFIFIAIFYNIKKLRSKNLPQILSFQNFLCWSIKNSWICGKTTHGLYTTIMHWPKSYVSASHIALQMSFLKHCICQTWPLVTFSCFKNSNYHFVEGILSRGCKRKICWRS